MERSAQGVTAVTAFEGGEVMPRVFSSEGFSRMVAAGPWTESDGVIQFSVTSDGTTGPGWLERFAERRFFVGDFAQEILLSKRFKPTQGVTSHIRVLKGELFSDKDRITCRILKEAGKRKLHTPDAEIACLIRERFSDEEIRDMGLSLINTMHKPISIRGISRLLAAGNSDGRASFLAGEITPSKNKWERTEGFAFVTQGK